jgi:hypothetical protein
MLRARMIRRVHRHGFGVMVDRDVGRAAQRKLDAGRRAAAACEVVYDEVMHGCWSR